MKVSGEAVSADSKTAGESVTSVRKEC